MIKETTEPNKATNIPVDITMNMKPTAYPRGDFGVTSPYPTVEIVTIENQNASASELMFDPGWFLSLR